MDFLDHKHPHYKRNEAKWRFAMDHLSGGVLDELLEVGGSVEAVFLNNDPGSSRAHAKQSSYLIQRQQGESDEAFEERKRIADYTPHFASAIIALTGMAWSNWKDAQFTWDDSELGNPKDPESIMHKIWDDCDGKGTNFESFHKQVITRLIACKEIGVLVKGVKRNKDKAAINHGTLQFALPQDIPHWFEKKDRLESVIISETKVIADSIEEEPVEAEVCFRYDLEGVTAYVKDKDGKAAELDGGRKPYGDKEFRYRTTNDKSTWEDRLPFKRSELPISANIGFMMALKANSIYNMESARDFQLWSSCFPKAMLDVVQEDGTLNKELYDEIKKAIKKGQNAWPGKGHRFDAPSVAGAEIRNATIEIKVKQFLKTFFQLASDQARERSATEIKMTFKAGVEAFLTYVVGVRDEIMNDVFFLLEQINFPNEPQKWGKTKVKSSDDFSHINIDEEIDRMVERWVPNRQLPPVEDIVYQIFVRAAERDRFDLSQISEEDIRASIQNVLAGSAQENDIFSSLRRGRVNA